MSGLYDQVQEAAAAVRSRWDGQPRAGIILGTGLGGLVEDIEAQAALAYNDIPHFPHSTAPSHKGELVCGLLAGKPVVAMQGRFHKRRALFFRTFVREHNFLKRFGIAIHRFGEEASGRVKVE